MSVLAGATPLSHILFNYEAIVSTSAHVNTAATSAALQDDQVRAKPDTPKRKYEASMSRSERRNKTKLIQVRCTPEEHGMIVNSAEAACLNVGEYVRRIALRRKIQPVTDYKMIMALSRLGGLQKHLFMLGHRADSKEYSEILTELKRTILRVDGALPRYVV